MNMRDDKPTGNHALTGLFRKKEETADEGQKNESEAAADGCGLNTTRGLLQGVIIERENKDREGVFYGAIMGRIRYNPSVGVSFIFEDAEGFWKVEIRGNNLEGLHRDLVLGRRELVHLGGAVTEIDIKAWTPPGKK